MASVKMMEVNTSFACFMNEEIRRQYITARQLVSLCPFDSAAFYF